MQSEQVCRDVNKDSKLKDKYKDQDLTCKDQDQDQDSDCKDKDKDLIGKDQDKDKDCAVKANKDRHPLATYYIKISKLY